MSRQDDIEALQEGWPFLRSALAFLAYLRRDTTEGCYEIADIFLAQLEKDLRKK